MFLMLSPGYLGQEYDPISSQEETDNYLPNFQFEMWKIYVLHLVFCVICLFITFISVKLKVIFAL